MRERLRKEPLLPWEDNWEAIAWPLINNVSDPQQSKKRR